jgi:hypothetical protein
MSVLGDEMQRESLSKLTVETDDQIGGQNHAGVGDVIRIDDQISDTVRGWLALNVDVTGVKNGGH